MEFIKKLDRKKIIGGIFVLVLLVALPITILTIRNRQNIASQAGNPVTVELSPATKSLAIGETTDIQVVLKAGTISVQTVEFSISFGVPNATNAANADFIPNPNSGFSALYTPAVEINNSAKTIIYKTAVSVQTAPITGNITLGTLKLTGINPGTAQINFIGGSFNELNGELTPTFVNGTYTVTSEINPGTSITPITSQPPVMQQPNSTPTATIIPEPTTPPVTPAPGQALLNIAVRIPGVGPNTGIGDNNNPRHTRSFDVYLFSEENQEIKEIPTKFDYENGVYNGRTMITDVPLNKPYVIKIRSDNSLLKNIGFITPESGKTYSINATGDDKRLAVGKLNTNTSPNALGIEDYQSFTNCLNNLPVCTSTLRALSDLNDDGIINLKDRSILIRSFVRVQGD